MSSEQIKRGRGRPRQSLPIEKPPTLSLSPRAARDITAIARDTKIDIEQVKEDVVTLGLIQARGMYSGVIEARKSLEAKRNEYRRKVAAAEPEDGRFEEKADNGINERSSTGPDEFDQGLRLQPSEPMLEPGYSKADFANSQGAGEPVDLVNDPLF